MSKRRVINIDPRGQRETIPYILDISTWPQGVFSNPVVSIKSLDEATDYTSAALSGSASISGTNITTPDFVANGLSIGFYKLLIAWDIDGDTVEAYAELEIE